MIQDDKSTLTIILGKQTISGTKSASGAYKNPNASVEISDKNFSIDVPKGISKIILKSLFEYEEATTKKDTPNFLFVLKQNEKEIKKVLWSDPDIFYKFEEFSGELIIEIDLQKFYSEDEKVKLDFSAHLECWLEESSWKPNAPQKKTASASGDADLEFGLPKVRFPGAAPEISLEISPTHSPGKDLKNVDANTDWGNPIFFNLWLDNKTNNTINIGNFTLVEDGKNIKDANLKEELKSKHKTIVVSETGSSGAATWIVIKNWKWYKNIGSGKFGIKQQNQIYKYFTKGKTVDEFGFSFDLKTDELSVNVRVPDYKIEAMNTYNFVIDVQNWLNGSTAIGLAVAYPPLLVPATIAGAALLITSLITSGEFESTKIHFKNIMDDPPQVDKNYNKLFLFKSRRSNKKTKLIDLHNKISKLIEAIIITSNRRWTAKMRRDETAVKKHERLRLYYLFKLKESLRTTSKILVSSGKRLHAFENSIKQNQVRNISKFIKSKEFPDSLVKIARKHGLSNINYKVARRLQQNFKAKHTRANVLTELGK